MKPAACLFAGIVLLLAAPCSASTPAPATPTPANDTDAEAVAVYETLPPIKTKEVDCSSDFHCSRDGDVDGTCQPDGRCTCSTGFGPPSALVGGRVQHLCYPQSQDVDVTLSFANGTCVAADVPRAVQSELIAAVENATQGTVHTAAFVCVDGVHAALSLKVEARHVAAGLVDGGRVASFLAVKVDADEDVRAVAGTVLAVVRTLVTAYRVPVDTGAETQWTPPPVGSVAPCLAPNAVKGLEVVAGTEERCVITACKLGFRKTRVSNGKFTACSSAVGVTDKSCLVDGDCSFDQGRTDCVEGLCLAPPPPPLPRAKVLVPEPRSLDTVFCLADRDCQVHGDTEASCNTTLSVAGDVSACVCGAGYRFPGPYIGTCMRPGATTMHVTWTVRLPKGNCVTFGPKQLAAATRLVATVLGGVATNVSHTCGSVTLYGRAHVVVSKVNEFGEGAQLLLTQLQEERKSGAYSELDSHGKIGSATLGMDRQCFAYHANATREDTHGNCQAVVCDSETSLQKQNGMLLRCVLPTVVQESGDDGDWTLKERTALAFGITCASVSIFAVLLLWWCYKKQRELEQRNIKIDTT
eukprot:Rhum_TRINITY_DN2015_c0_g1::Rhum_TRINITY_DN2015_c0_g1_i1::g.5429::m.5429